MRERAECPGVLYLVRHGEDAAAPASRFGDEGLTPAGQEQARKLARALRAVDLSACLSSPLRRAVETARALTRERGIPLDLDANLAEGSLGDLHGLERAEAARRYPEDLRLGSSVVARIAATGRTAPGGESRARFLERAHAAAQRLRRELERGEGNIVVVSHGGLLNYMLQILLGMPTRDEVPFGFDHCGVVRVVQYREPPGFGPFPMLRLGGA